MTAFPLLDVPTTIERARTLCVRIDAAADPRRAVTDLSLSTVASMAILVGQLDAIARAAAALAPACLPRPETEPGEAYRAGTLAGLLIEAGYLRPAAFDPPAIPHQKEPAHGEG